MAREDERDINPTAKGGPASPVIPGTEGAQAGGGPHVGAAEGNVKGVLGMGSGPVGQPTGGMGSDAADGDDRPAEEAAGTEPGIVAERNVSVLGSGPGGTDR